MSVAPEHEHEFKVSGSLEEWQERISRYCIGNSRMLFAVSTAFAASVMRLVDAECGIIQLIGLFSTGKSTLLRIAASVNGSRKSVRNWRSTANGLEGTIALHNELSLSPRSRSRGFRVRPAGWPERERPGAPLADVRQAPWLSSIPT